MHNVDVNLENIIFELLQFDEMVPNPVTPPTKEFRLLKALCCRKKITRFYAEKLLHGHALNSTISQLFNDNGVLILQAWVSVPNALGGFTCCREYTIDPDPVNLRRCQKLLLSWGYILPDPPPENKPPLYIPNMSKAA